MHREPVITFGKMKQVQMRNIAHTKWTKFGWSVNVRAVQKLLILSKYVNLVDLVKSFPTSLYSAEVGVDAAEKKPLKVPDYM